MARFSGETSSSRAYNNSCQLSMSATSSYVSAGAAAGFIEAAIVHPLDMIKTRYALFVRPLMTCVWTAPTAFRLNESLCTHSCKWAAGDYVRVHVAGTPNHTSLQKYCLFALASKLGRKKNQVNMCIMCFVHLCVSRLYSPS